MEYFRNFKLHTASFNQYKLQRVFLVPAAIQNFRLIIQNKCGIKAFPITHINRYRSCDFVDINNVMGQGHNYVYSITGVDKSQVLSYGVELKTYLE